MENKRILSTVTLIIFLAFLCFLCWFAIWLAVSGLSALDNYEPVSTGDGTSDLIVNGAVGLTVGGCLMIALACMGFTAITSLVCLGFSIRNTRVKVKSVRVINIILCCLFAACAATVVIAFILLREL